MKQTLTIKLTIIGLIHLTTIYSQSTFGIYNEATQLFNQQKYQEALNLFNQILNEEEPDFDSYFRRSYCNFYLEHYQAALNDVESAYDLAPKDHSYFFLKAQAYDKLKNFELADYYLDLAIKFLPSKLYYYKYRSALNLELGNYEKAEHDFNILINANNEDYKSYYGRGLAKFNQKKKTEACLDWRYAKENHKASNRFFFYKCTDVDLRNKEITPTQEQIIIPPVFKYEEDSLISQFLSSNISYSVNNYLNQLEATSIVKFVLTKQKQIKDFEIVYYSDTSINESIKKAVLSSEKHFKQCALKENQPTDYTYYLPVTFKLKNSNTPIITLIDSLKYYQQKNEAKKIFDISDAIIKRNPFMIEAATANKSAAKELNLTNHYININDLCKTSSNYEICNEVAANTKFYTIYFNSTWQITDKNNAEYQRICEWDAPQIIRSENYNEIINYFFEDMQGDFYDYTNSGTLKAKGSYYANKKYGTFDFYYNNGHPSAKMEFLNDQLIDTAYFYLDNGFKNQTIVFKDKQFDVIEYYDENGNNLLLDGNGFWEYSKNDVLNQNTLKIEGNYKNYERDGEWVYYFGDDIFVEEKYKKGVFVSGKYYKEGKSKSSPMHTKSTLIQSWIFIPSFITVGEQPELTKEYAESEKSLITKN